MTPFCIFDDTFFLNLYHTPSEFRQELPAQLVGAEILGENLDERPFISTNFHIFAFTHKSVVPGKDF